MSRRIFYLLCLVLLTLLAGFLIGVSFFKLRYGLYNALDLAIFNQVFWQTTHGNFFGMTIHPHSYLGDHFDLFILLLAPFYAIVSRPETLLVLQALAVAATPIPLLLLHRPLFDRSRAAAVLAVLGLLLWTINPYVHNAFFFEFHTLIFAAPLLVWSYWAYQKRRLKWFWLFLILLLTLREDVAFTVQAFALLALLEKRELRWWLPQMATAALWFFGATSASSFLNTSGSYKFFDLYAWMGKGVSQIFWFLVTQPSRILEHVVSAPAIKAIGLATASFLFLPTLAPKALILAVPSLFVIALTDQGLDTSFLITHYQIIFLAGLLIAFFDAIPRMVLLLERAGSLRKTFQMMSAGVLVLLLVIAGIQSSLHSPFFVRASAETNLYRLPQRSYGVRREFLERLKDTDRILAGSNFLTNFGDREMLMSLHYAYIGKKQFSEDDFPLPTIDAALFDSEEMIRLIVVKERFSWAGQGIHDGSRRLREYLARENLRPEKIVDDTMLWTKMGTLMPFSVSADTAEKTALGAFELTACEHRLCLTLETRHPAQGEDVLIRFTLKDTEGRQVWQSFYLPSYGLYMPHEFEEPRKMTTEWTLTLPNLPEGAYEAVAALEPIEGEHLVSGLRHAAFLPKKEPTVLDTRSLGIVTVDGDGAVVEVDAIPEEISSLFETAEDGSDVR
ncbi:hypothetical protein A3D69_02645 [Candidatus Uhrbacteria bacterium RIFCSPHIGHO2_02_FULL_54_11]|nr:MAG: hypothetical protein A3D69_02645 [Candidatus Uhrbacteria bacterium RIFCSPHIGHO2_02_FULL_54_11]